MPLQTIDLRQQTAPGVVLHGAVAGDLTGISVASAGDINGDGFDDLVVGASYASGAVAGSTQGGRGYVVFGSAERPSASLDLAAIGTTVAGFAILGEEAGDSAGRSVAAAGDLNGDGFGDLVIGAPKADGPGNARADGGAAYVIFGKAAPFAAAVDLREIAAGTGGFILHGAAAGDLAGFSARAAGDIDGDGFDDLAVAALDADGSGGATENAGTAYVIYGGNRSFAAVDLAAPQPADHVLTITGGNFAFDETGTSVAAAGDINGDGLDDLVIGAPNADGPSRTEDFLGTTYVMFGKAGGHGATVSFADIASGSLGFILYGEDPPDEAGFSATSAGDFNGDGIGDLVIGAPNAAGPGDARPFAGDSYVVFGRTGGFPATIDLTSLAGGTGGFIIHGRAALDRLGNSVAPVGDFNGDGFDDIAIGALGSDGPGAARVDAGETYLLLGRAGAITAPIDVGAADWGLDGVVILGGDGADQSGVSISGAGDVDGDGYADLLIGGFGAAGPGNSRSFGGEAQLLYGSDLNGMVNRPGTAVADTLVGTATADIMVGGGGNDTLVGQGGADAITGGAGDDTLRVRDGGFRRIDGGHGVDTLALDTAETLLDLPALGRHRLHGIEAIDLAGNGANGLVVDRIALLNLPDSGTTLRVSGGTDDFVVVTGAGWAEGGSIGGQRSFANGAARLLVDATVRTFLVEGTGQAVLGGPPVVQAEGNAGQASCVVTLRRLGDVSAALSLDYRVDGVGLRPADANDFAGGTLPTGTVAFAAGAAETRLTVSLASDTLVETNENFAVILATSTAGVLLADAAAIATIAADDVITDIAASNGATGQGRTVTPVFYGGPVAGIEKELILTDAINTNIQAAGPNWFIRSGSGDDAIAVAAGTNVLDGGGGSNFLTGAAGTDTFFLDNRNATADVWSSVVGFGKGDSATVWGVTPADFTITWLDGLGAAGFTGLTMQATAPGKPTASLTLAGFTKADIDSGRLVVAFGQIDPTSPYLWVHGAG